MPASLSDAAIDGKFGERPGNLGHDALRGISKVPSRVPQEAVACRQNGILSDSIVRKCLRIAVESEAIEFNPQFPLRIGKVEPRNDHPQSIPDRMLRHGNRQTGVCQELTQ